MALPVDDCLPLYSLDAVRAIEHAAIHTQGIDGYVLMCRAGQAAFDALCRHWPQARRLRIACGGGNNGGDGLVLARLARGAGLDVRVIATSAQPPRTAEALAAWRDWHAAGGQVEAIDDAAPWGDADVLVDAVLGIGLQRAPDGPAARLIDALAAHPAPCFALDVPSGVDADTGAVPGRAVRAQLTLSFIVHKRGLFTGPARSQVGRLELASLGVAPDPRIEPAAACLAPAARVRRLPPRPADSHKGAFGHVLVVGGDLGYGGALRLAAEGALRSGAGLVSALTREAHRGGLLAALPECMVGCSEHGELPLELLHRVSVIALGPGLGRGDWGRDLLPRLLDGRKPAVLDADALNLIAESPRPLPGCVLTPHPGEAARLLGLASAAEVQRDRFAALAALVQRFDATVVLKGAGSLVGAPGQRPQLVDAGNPGMASGGMGDVLTGIVAGLLAQGLSSFEAALTGAWLHALAGDAAAADGSRGMVARDLFPPLRRLANPGAG